MKPFTIRTSKGPNLTFRGTILADVNSYEPRERGDEKEHYSRLQLYRTDKDAFVCVRMQCVSETSEVVNTAAAACEQLSEVHDFFGYGRLSKLLYETAGPDYEPVRSV